MAEMAKATEKTSKPEAAAPARAQQRQPAADFAPESVRPDLAISKAAGNQAMQRLLRGGVIQAKLNVSQPGDAHEQEADRIAEQAVSSQPVGVIQRKGNACASGTPCQECEGEHAIQRKAEPGQKADAKSSSRILPQRSGGQPLSASARAFFEPRFGYDFSAVRVHNYPQVDTANHQLGARAFTYGRDIAFAAGQYSPDTTTGKKLLAHELTHVIQQAGGHRLPGTEEGATSVQPIAPSVQANGKLTEQDLILIRQWLEEGSTPTGTPSHPLLNRPFGTRPDQTWDWATPGQASESWRFPSVSSCPTSSCHQVAQGFERAARERQEQQRREEHLATWPGLHREQHARELREQGTSLREDIQTSQLMAAQLRMQMFDRVLATQTDVSVYASRGVASASPLSEELRESWLEAQQATMVLDALLKATGEEPPAEVSAPFRRAYLSYYAALAEALRVRDADEQRRLSMFNRPATLPSRCPQGSCHQPSGAGTLGGGHFSPLPGLHNSPFDSLLRAHDEASTKVAPEVVKPEKGVRTRRLEESVARANVAATRESLRAVVEDYHWAVKQMDVELRAHLQDTEGQKLVEHLEFTEQLLQREQALLETHPEARKVQAVFYPKHEFVQRKDEQGQTREMAKGIPWQFYLTHTPVTDPRYVPAGFEWQLHDLTAPRRNRRTVVQKYQVTQIEALARERGPWRDPLPITEMDPPKELFEKLNHPDFFPEGMLYWTYPMSGRTDHVETTADTPFGTWLALIGMSIALVGSLVFAPFSTPMLLSVALGTGLSIAGRLHRLEEMEEHGVLTQADVNRFYWDLSMDIVSALTLGFGRVAMVTARAGNLVRAASAARSWFIVRRVQIGMDVINVGVITHDFVHQYRAIQDSNMTPEQKREALAKLTAFAIFSGAMMIIPLRSGLQDLRRGTRLTMDIDPANGRLIADLEAETGAAAAAEHLRTRARDDAKIVGRTRYTHPDTNESHSYALWSDGRITRCSPEPCAQIAESVVARLDDLRPRMLSDSEHIADMQELLRRARLLREEAEQLAAGPAATLTANRERLMGQTRQIEADMASLEAKVARENRLSERTGREEAQQVFGTAALDYNREHYRWVRSRSTGRLEFQRRSLAVPWKEFNPTTGKFEITRSLFVPVTPERLRELQETSLTRDFPIRQATQSLEELRALRPASPRAGARPPNDWVLVRINDDNLVHFINEPVPHGTIFEFPDGSRVWRTPQNTIATEGAVRAPIGRRGFERTYHTGGGEEGVPLVSITGVEHQRAHPRGQGTGFELFNHIPYAPTYVNQQLQARGIELYISELRRLHPDKDFRLYTEHTVFAGTRRQSWIDYRIDVAGAEGRRQLMTLRIGTDYSNTRAPAEPEIRSMTSKEDDIALLMSVDMPSALAALEERIRQARLRRRR